MDSPFEMESSVIVIKAIKGNSSLISGYQFYTNGNTFILPRDILPMGVGDSCDAQLFIADMSMQAGSLFSDSSIAGLFGHTVLSVGLRDSNGDQVSYNLNDRIYIQKLIN